MKNDGLHDISIYLGNVCNFNCTYCDRDYIKDTIGGQHMTTDDIPDILQFLTYVDANRRPPNMFSFHGGEPFAYVKIMDAIMSEIVNTIPGDYHFFIQTNGSLMLNNRWFFEKWGRRLIISISYDFMYQDINRTQFGIVPAIEMLKECGVADIQFQYVMPLHDPKVFSLLAAKAISDVCIKHGVRNINLIPLRHIRGKDKFRVIVDEINVPQCIDALIKFIDILYVLGLDVIVDGHSIDIDKHYFDNHKQLVLSPDGYIYPEYDFLEYKRIETTIGRWKQDISLVRTSKNEDTLLLNECVTCSQRAECGLKFLHKIFDKPPSGECVQFYRLLTVAIKHAQKLRQKRSILEWVGI